MKNLKFIVLSLVLFSFISHENLHAHCDGEDGPVVIAAKKALEEENINLVLIWVQKKDENAVRDVYEKTIHVRKLDPAAKDIADSYFFDTVVRLHRMGEGAPFTGVKPAGYNNDPSVQAADRTIDESSLKNLYKMLTDELHTGLHSAYEEVESLKKFDKNDTEAGRKYVAAYVNFLHYVEGIYKAAQSENNHGLENHKH
jgi:hypothetical protein